ncbi:MAG: cupin domain-containing protein [Pseudomonadota bacterium]
MKAQMFVVTPDDRAPALNVLGTDVTVLASNAATGSYEITLQRGGEGLGAPPHSHDWDESFYVLQGGVEFTCAGQTRVCGPGTLVHVPAGTVHGFRYAAGGGEMLEFTGQGGLATQLFSDLDSNIPPGPPDFPTLLAVLEKNAVQLAACDGPAHRKEIAA